jgi:hypothetical protein
LQSFKALPNHFDRENLLTQLMRLDGFNLSAFQGQLFGPARSPAPRHFEQSPQRSKAALSEPAQRL